MNLAQATEILSMDRILTVLDAFGSEWTIVPVVAGLLAICAVADFLRGLGKSK